MDTRTILVVGAGPAGLTAACELRRHGASVRIVDSQPQPASGSRSILLWPPQLEILRDHGMLEEALQLGIRPGAFTYTTRDKELARFPFTPTTMPLILPQHHTDRLLEQALNATGVQVERPVRVTGVTQTPEAVTVQAIGSDNKPTALTVPWLIGADGAHSIVRAAQGFTTVRTQSDSRFLLAEGRLDPPPEGTDIRYVLTSGGPLLIAPLPANRYRVASTVTDTGEPTRGAVQALLAQRYSNPRIHDLTLLTHFTAEESLVHTMRKDRVFLLGDAAHTHYPVGGQGANLGMQDARNLAWKLAGVICGDFCPAILDTYSIERRHAAEQVLRMTGVVARTALLRPPWNLLRNIALRGVQCVPAAQNWYTAKLAGQKTGYPNTELGSPASGRHQHPRSESAAGHRPPTWIQNELSYTQYQLVSSGPALETTLATQAAQLAHTYPAINHRHLITPRQEAILIRPDGYIAAAATTDLTAIAQLLSRIFPADMSLSSKHQPKESR